MHSGSGRRLVGGLWPLIHRPSGLMRAALSKKELDALNRRHLKFNEAEQAAILRKLRSR